MFSIPSLPTVTKRRVRIALLALVILSVLAVAQGWATRPSRDSAPSAEAGTVITAQGRDHLVDTGRMVAFDENGTILAEHRTHDTYFDVDPLGNESRTVEYVAVDYEPPDECPDRFTSDWCARNLLLRTNLTTNETAVVWEEYYPKLHKIHDVDRINDTHVVVANIYSDTVEIVDVSADETTWTWNANESFDYETTGGKGPEGWTHVNDVELVRDGWIMVSLRNHDQVVFLDPGSGLVENWTIGCDDCHDVMFEQHNPDYVPGTGGTPPTVIVADSENDRIVEFRRVDGTWLRSWTYTNPGMHWPRDADRLSNGNTLITDSNANRVVEVAPNGTVVWSTTIGNPYEAERLGTGDESSAVPVERVTPRSEYGLVDTALLAYRNLVPSKILSAALFVLPYWAGTGELLALVVGVVALLTGVGLEAKWFVGRRFPGVGARLHAVTPPVGPPDDVEDADPESDADDD